MSSSARFLVGGLLCLFIGSSAAAGATPIPVKVVVVTMFEVGTDTGDTPGELQYWVERDHLDRVLPLPAGYHAVRMNSAGEMAVLTGQGTAHAAAAIMALGLDPRFDLTHAYWIIAGIAGGSPDRISLGSAAWARWVVDGELGYEIDAREMPPDWPTGYLPLRKTRPFEEPAAPLEGQVYELNAGLAEWAFGLTRNVALEDSDRLRAARGAFEGEAAQKAPFVTMGDEISSSTYWHGRLADAWATQWVRYFTGGKGEFLTTAMEDTGTLAALRLLANAGRVDWSRILVLRAVSNYDRQPRGMSAADSLAQQRVGTYSAYLPSLEAAYRVGHTVVAELLAHWARWGQKDASPVAPLADAEELRKEVELVTALLPRLKDRAAAQFVLAHDEARLGHLDRALALLRQAMAANEGFDPGDDPAFAPIAKRPEFQEMVERVRRRYPAVHRARTAFTVPEKELIPEGLASDPVNGELYMGSLNLRKIVRIAKDGAVTDFSRPMQPEPAPICGVKADSSVWAATCSDDGRGAELLDFDFSGALAARYAPRDPGPHLLNDLVLRGADQIYVTDSLGNRVYRFDRSAHTFATVPLCRPVYYPNGIALSRDRRRLYVADAFGILEVELGSGTSREADPGPGNTVSGVDGLYWYRGSLIGIQNSLGSNRVARFFLSPDGLRVMRTTILESRTDQVELPTTGAISGSKFYFISNSQIDNLRNGKVADPAKLAPVRIAALDLDE